MAIRVEPNHHPTDQQLQDFLHGTGDDFSKLLEHVEHCQDCEERLSVFADAEFSIAEHLDSLAHEWGDGVALEQSIKESLMTPQRNRFEVLNEIAHGGMGMVVRAFDCVLKRIVALKIIKPGNVHSSEAIARFVQEARISGTLQHPGVVPIYDLGLIEHNKPFLAMKLVEGQTLSEIIKSKKPTNEMLEIFVQVCQTMGYVHSKEVVHRDLTPSNVMVGEFGEVQVMDWGLAKTPEENFSASNTIKSDEAGESVLIAKDDTVDKKVTRTNVAENGSDQWKTRSGAIMGTPSYMSPEQATGDYLDVDKRFDVFALGAILHEILTGVPPCGDVSGSEALAFAQNPDYEQIQKRLQNTEHDAQLIELAIRCLGRFEDRPTDAKSVGMELAKWKTSTQDRLREAEIEIAKTEARMAADRKRRRLWTALSASLACLILVTASSVAYVNSQRMKALQAAQENQKQIVENDRQINLFLSQASEKRKLAIENESTNSDEWQAVLHEVELANQLVNDDTNLELSRLSRNLKAEIEKQISVARDTESNAKRLSQTLDLLNAAHHSVADFENCPQKEVEGRKGVALFEEAFEKFGIPVESDPKEARLKFVAAPQHVREAMTFSLFEWHLSYRTHNDAGGYYGRWLRTLFEYFDTNEERFNLRRAYLNDDSGELMSILRKKETVGELEYLIAAECLERCGMFGKRREMLKEAILTHPNSYWVNRYLAEDFAQRNPRMLESALRHYYVCAAIDPENVETKSDIGGILIKQNKFRKAQDWFKDILKDSPDNPRLLTNYGAMLMVNGRPRTAIRKLEKAIQADPQLIQAYVNLGQANSMLKNDEAAAEAYRTAIQLNPELADTYVSMANSLIARNKLDEAMKTLERLFEFAPDNRHALSTQAEILSKQNRYDEAESVMKKAIQLSPQEVNPYVNLALVQMMKQDLETAELTLKSAEKIDPTDIRVQLNLMELYTELEDFESFKKVANRLATLNR